MKISIRSALMSDKIKELFDGNVFNGVRYEYLEKQGIELLFTVSGDDIEALDLVALTKNTIKSTNYGKGLYFSVTEKP